MARIMILAIALALPLLVGCAGMYVAGDIGPHGAGVTPTQTVPRAPDDTSR